MAAPPKNHGDNAASVKAITPAAVTRRGCRLIQRRARRCHGARPRQDRLVAPHAAELVREGPGRWIPAVQVLLERGLDDDLEIARNRRIELPRMGIELLDRVDERGPVGVLERALRA